MSHLKLAEVRVQDFRVLQDVCLPLAHTTLLLGENNSGKTSFLAALDAAFNGRCSHEDLFVGPEGERAGHAEVDLLIVPAKDEEFGKEVRAREKRTGGACAHAPSTPSRRTCSNITASPWA